MNNQPKFPLLDGDDEDSIHSEEEDVQSLTEGYIEAVANAEDTSQLASEPILHVLSRETGFRDVLEQESEPKAGHQKVKLTHLTLVDGDNNQIHARLATHIADAGRGLGEGDVIRLNMFTELTYRINDESPRMPTLFILRYTRVGRMPVPVQSELHHMLQYTHTLSALQHGTKSRYFIDPLTQDPPECTYKNRLCRKYGVNFIGCCICEAIPVAGRDLSIIAEDCHYINKPFSEIKENKQKRFMLYWWYATNIYSITGQHNRGKLPDCLEYAIKATYPETKSEDFVGYIPTTNKHAKK